MSFWNNMLDVVAPARCGQCFEEGHWWCLSDGVTLPWPLCLDCHKNWHPTQHLSGCRATKPIIYLGWYREPALRQMLYHWKFDGQWAISADWATLLGAFLKDETLFSTGNFLPVPSHWLRSLSRGYNQAEILTRQLSKATDWPVWLGCTRVKRTKPQAQLNDDERQANVEDVFALRPNFPLINGQGVWIVDDIVTSGATIVSLRQLLQSVKIPINGMITIALAEPERQTEATEQLYNLWC